MDSLHERVIAQIRTLAEQRKVLLSHVPDRAGISRSHFWEVLAGNRSPTLQWLGRVAAALESEVVDLLAALPASSKSRRPSSRLPFKEAEPGSRRALPFYSLKAAASGFSRGQEVEEEAWVEVPSKRKLRRGMFVAQVVGRSMEPLIANGSYCLFVAPTQARNGHVLLVQHRAISDPDHVGRYTVKRYQRERGKDGSTVVRLIPENDEYQELVIGEEDSGELIVMAEFLEVLALTR